MEGLGDLVAKITEVTGIKKVVETITDGECGCQSRQRKLNEMFPFNAPKDIYYKNKLENEEAGIVR